jgi:DNA-directed RNA polymerase subunit RPC12/RpoP
MDNRLRQFGYLLSSRLAQALYGRNGFDNLARTCYTTAFILMVINIFADSVAVYLIWVALLFYATFRIFSKNVPKRYAENQKFMSMTKVPRSYLNLVKLQIRDRETSRYYICGKCHQQIRVPKGKGRIEIRCPKCGERFIRKT